MSADLNTIWFVLVGVLLTGYVILDGFDLGVGMLQLFAKKDEHRRILLNSIGPFWDGNEVWLVTGGGALFAAFPEVYATAFSGFYTALMLLLAALIFRAASIEFRSKHDSLRWRNAWDRGFSIGSFVAALLMGVALGNIACGIPLTVDGEYIGGLLGLLRPYPLLVGITAVSLLTLHGSLYLAMKTEGELLMQVQGWVKRGYIVFLICYLLLTIASLVYLPGTTVSHDEHPALFILQIVTLLVLVNILVHIRKGKFFPAFIGSSALISILMALFGVWMFPNMIRSNPIVENSLTIMNASSSPMTLKIMLIIACIGMPLVITYTVIIYRIFRGKVKLTNSSY